MATTLFPPRRWVAVPPVAASSPPLAVAPSEPPPSWRFVVLTLGPAVVAWWALYTGGQQAGLDRLAAKAVASAVAFLAGPALALPMSGCLRR